MAVWSAARDGSGGAVMRPDSGDGAMRGQCEMALVKVS